MSCPTRMTVTLAFVSVLVTHGCTGRRAFNNYEMGDSGHRLVRVSFKGQKASFKVRVNSGPVERIANASFTNLMTAFGFQYGDIVVWEAVRDSHGRETSEPDGVSAWWFGYVEGTRAAFYSINSDNIDNFFKTPLYHWTGPEKTPRPLAAASFYKDGKCIGQGRPGFCAMVESAGVVRKGAAFLLSPNFTTDPLDQPWPATEQLDRWLTEAGVHTNSVYAVDIDFARMMNER